MVVGHAVKEEGVVSGVGHFHLVPYGVPIVGPCRPDGAGGYGGWPAPVCCPCLGYGRAFAGWRAVVGCIRWSAWKPMEAFKTPLR